MQKITIGRDPSCDIRIDESVDKVSRNHASIYQTENGQLVLEDYSTNGTYVNGQLIHSECAIIRKGDRITLGRNYELSWSEIGVFFPSTFARETVKFDNTYVNEPISRTEKVVSQPVTPKRSDDDKEIIAERKKWNWGAAGIYPLWGFANGVWWLFIVSLIIGVGCCLPLFVGQMKIHDALIIVIIGWVVDFILRLILGARGSNIAWHCKKWRDKNHFILVQSLWKGWGIFFFILNMLSMIISIYRIVELMKYT